MSNEIQIRRVACVRTRPQGHGNVYVAQSQIFYYGIFRECSECRIRTGGNSRLRIIHIFKRESVALYLYIEASVIGIESRFAAVYDLIGIVRRKQIKAFAAVNIEIKHICDVAAVSYYFIHARDKLGINLNEFHISLRSCNRVVAEIRLRTRLVFIRLQKRCVVRLEIAASGQ